MSLQILYTHVNGTLTANISAATTLIPVDSDTLAILSANVNFAGGNWTYLTLDNEIYSEEVKVIGVTGGFLSVIRAQSGSSAMAFSSTNTVLYDHVGAAAIADIIAANPAPSAVTVGGGGIATVTQPTTGNYVVNVAPPVFTGSDGVEVTGSWPDYGISYVSSGCGCGSGGGSSGSGVNELILTSSILTGNITGTVLTLGLPAPTFEGTSGVTVSGSWTTGYTIAGGGAGGTGTVESVAVGAGLSLSGTPTVNPTIAITNTGVTPGTYGAMTFNAQGQLTSITSGFSPVGNITLTNGGSIVQVGSTYNITLNNAAVGVLGIVELADSSGSFNPAEDTMATTSKMVAKAISALSASITGAGSSTGEATSAYSNTLTGTSVSLTIASGDTALLLGEVEVIDSASATVPPAYGVAVFATGGVVLYSSRICLGGKQCIVGIVTATMSTTIAIATTALTGTQSVTSATLTAVVV